MALLDATPASDIWSLGCTAVELFTGKPPYFELSTTQACFRMVEDPHPPFPPNCSARMTDFLARTFVKDCTRRESAKQLLQCDLILLGPAPAPVPVAVAVADVPDAALGGTEVRIKSAVAVWSGQTANEAVAPALVVQATKPGDTRQLSASGPPGGAEKRGSISSPATSLGNNLASNGGKSLSKSAGNIAAVAVGGAGGGPAGALLAEEAAGAAPPTPPPLPTHLIPDKRKKGSSAKRACYKCDAPIGAFSNKTCKRCSFKFCKKCVSKVDSAMCLDCEVVSKMVNPFSF